MAERPTGVTGGSRARTHPSPLRSSSLAAPLLSLRSAAYGVAGSGVAKLALTDAWTHTMVKYVIQAWAAIVPLTSRESTVVGAQEADTQWLFYTVRVSLVLVKLYLDSRMLQYFVKSMHASSSLLAATYNQCCAIILAGLCGVILFSESLPPSWILGATLILAGVCCVQWGQNERDSIDDEHTQSQSDVQAQVSTGLDPVAHQHTDARAAPSSVLRSRKAATTSAT